MAYELIVNCNDRNETETQWFDSDRHGQIETYGARQPSDYAKWRCEHLTRLYHLNSFLSKPSPQYVHFSHIKCPNHFELHRWNFPFILAKMLIRTTFECQIRWIYFFRIAKIFCQIISWSEKVNLSLRFFVYYHWILLKFINIHFVPKFWPFFWPTPLDFRILPQCQLLMI